jgi:hypothetical protein
MIRAARERLCRQTARQWMKRQKVTSQCRLMLSWLSMASRSLSIWLGRSGRTKTVLCSWCGYPQEDLASGVRAYNNPRTRWTITASSTDRVRPPHATLLSWRGDDRSTQVAVGRQTAAIAHQVDARQGHEGSQLLQKFHRRESHPCGPVRPRVRKGVDEIAIGVLLQTLQRHGTSRGRADQALQLIAPMGGDLAENTQLSR